MGTNVKLADDLVEKARKHARAAHRTVPSQIEFYYQIATIAEDNPDLSFSMIAEILRELEEEATEEYTFSK